jgi:CubicO group peptidase (beta-lactamase class C family)
MADGLQGADLQGRLQDALCRLAPECGVPGSSAAIVTPAGPSLAWHGVRNVRTGEPIEERTTFQIGSITKVITATLAISAVDEGLVSLDSRVADLGTGWRPSEAQVGVTLRQLLSHTAGVEGDFLIDTGEDERALAAYAEECSALGPVHEPGATASYCNSGFALVGRVLEVVWSDTFDEVVRKRFTVPCGLRSFSVAPGHKQPDRASGHVHVGGEAVPLPNVRLPMALAPAGSRASSAIGDLVRLMRLHLDVLGDQPHQGVISVSAARRMLTAHASSPQGDWTYAGRGLGWELFGRGWMGHDGATPGQAAFLRLNPDLQIGFALLTNGGAARRLLHGLASELADVLPGIVRQAPEPRPHAAASKSGHGVFANWLQTYELGTGGDGSSALSFRANNDPLGLVRPGADALTPLSGGLWARQNGSDLPTPVILRHAAPGIPAGAYIGQRLVPRVGENGR